MKNDSGFKTLFSIILCNLVCAGLLLVNNSSTWDSLLLTNAYDFGNNEAMKNCIFNTGRRIEYFIALFIFHFPYWLMLLKALSFGLLVGIQFFIYKILENIFDDNHRLNLLLSIFIINFPLYVLWLEPIMFSYTFCEFLFFAAMWLYIAKWQQQQHWWGKVVAFLPIGGLLFFSFEIQSFYVFTYAFLLVLFVHQYQIAQGFWNNVGNFIRHHFLLILFPIFSFWLWNKLFPINGMAKVVGYNQISFSVKSLAYHFAFFNFKLLVALPYLLAKLAVHNPFTTVVSGVVGLVVFYFMFKNIGATTFNTAEMQRNAVLQFPLAKGVRGISFAAWRNKNNLPLWLILLIAATFFIAALLPYSIVGKDYGALNRNCRNGLLAGFGIVFLIVMLIDKYISSHRAKGYLFACLFALCSIGSNLSYIYWQAYYVRFQKAQQLFAENVSHFKSDYLIVTESGNNPMHQHFTSYEMNFMLKEKVRSEKYLVMENNSIWCTMPDSFLKTTAGYRHIFMYSDFDNKVDSPVYITLHTAPNAMLDVENIVWQYWRNGCDAKNYPMQLTINDER